MDNMHQQRVINLDRFFDDHFLNAKLVYMAYFNELPSLQARNHIDGEKAFEAFKLKFRKLIVYTHQYRRFNDRKNKLQFDKTLVILNNYCMVEFDEDYCEVLHSNKQGAFLEQMNILLFQCKEKQKRPPLEINLIIKSYNGFELKRMEIKRTKVNLDLLYEEEFLETDALIRRRLSRKNDKGIVLLHGLPGTGKTTYLRHLIGKVKKRILFLSPAMAAEMLHPSFITLLINHPNTILVIEDAENIIMDRKLHSGSSVSNLLNISDGILADCLNVQLICTFNSPLTMIDQALLRKGRLIAKYEFGKLSVAKSQQLSDHLGFTTTISRPMAIADIAGQDEKTQPSKKADTIGFRTTQMVN